MRKLTPREELIFSRLPKEAKEIVLSNPEKQKEVNKIVDRIFSDYRDDLQALAKE